METGEIEIIEVTVPGTYPWTEKIKSMEIGGKFQTDAIFQSSLRCIKNKMEKEGIIVLVEKKRYGNTVIVTRTK